MSDLLRSNFLNKKKLAVVAHSGGMDSSLCLAEAVRTHGAGNVLSLSFNYGQRHFNELHQAVKICHEWHIDHEEIDVTFLSQLTHNALVDHDLMITHKEKSNSPNTLVMGRNGLWARLAAIKAQQLGANTIYLGIIEVEAYRDCSRNYMNLMEHILRIDLDNPHFEICTPLVFMTKKQTLELAYQWNLLTFLLQNTITCYNNIPSKGCETCPACLLRNEGISEFSKAHPNFDLP